MAEVALLPLARIPRQVSRGGAPPRPKPFQQAAIYTQPQCWAFSARCVTKAGPSCHDAGRCVRASIAICARRWGFLNVPDFTTRSDLFLLTLAKLGTRFRKQCH